MIPLAGPPRFPVPRQLRRRGRDGAAARRRGPRCNVPNVAVTSKETAMTSIVALWLPILLAAVMVFLVSSVIHMASPWHKADYPRIPSEERVMDLLRPLAIPPGDYMVPRAG